MKITSKIVIIVLSLLLLTHSYFNYLKPVEGNMYLDKDNKYYVNNLYQSNGFHYNFLSFKNKRLYDEILKNYINFTENAEINMSDYDCNNFQTCDVSIPESWNALMLDHPELIQLSGYSYKYYNDSPIVKLRLQSALLFDFQYYLGIKKIAIMIDNIKKETKNMHEREKVKYVYEWIGKQSSYDKMFTFSSKNQSIYSVFIKNSGVCAAYAKTAQIIFQNIGIESYLIIGQSTGPHMWNIVKVDDNYYYFDATVASALKEDNEHYYDGLKQDYLKGFSINNREIYPETTTNEYLLEI